MTENKKVEKKKVTVMTENKKVEEKKVTVHSEGCISCGACIAICPSIFKFNDQNKSYAAKQSETSEELDCAKQAAAACPVNVIDVKD